MLKLMIVAVFILNTGNVIANENQYDNKYYDYSECVNIVLYDLVSDQSACLNEYGSRECTLTEKEIKENIIVYCGEDLQDAKQERKNKDLNE
jgi:hypothetical protein